MKTSLHKFALTLVAATLGLIFLGGLVKTTGASLSVPDWPLSYGSLLPPMIGGIIFEHTHRLVAGAVGLLTLIMAIFFTIKTKERWLKTAAWTAFGLVVLQGVLGGLTVLFLLPKPISIGHACLAQTYFCLIVSIAVWTSPFWQEKTHQRTEPPGVFPLHQLAVTLFGVSYVQLILGAVVRHFGFAHSSLGLTFHIFGAITVALLSLWIAKRAFTDHPNDTRLKKICGGLIGAVLFQIALGGATYFVRTHRFDVIPLPWPAIATVTLHVANAAAVLGLSVLVALVTVRTKPETHAPYQANLKDYFELTKPGISFMAGITAFAGFILGSEGDVNIIRLTHTCIGTLMAAAGAGILNMVFERDSDALMRRTQKRPIPSGRLNFNEALFVGLLLSFGSVLYLSWAVNFLTAIFSGLTLSIYLYIYTPLKKISPLCVTIGAVAGALPPVMGWTAATGRVGIEALILFGILFFWQFPHFLSLAWLYKEDYSNAKMHMLPEEEPMEKNIARRVLMHSLALLVVSVLPTIYGLTGFIYFGIAIVLGLTILVPGIMFYREATRPHARRLFFASIFYIPLLVAVMVLNR